jgi:hypothetical protein
MDLQERSDRIWLCSVVLLHIVEYSKNDISRQIPIKERLNRLVSGATQQVTASDRIILDMVEGAALCFLRDPKDALFAALNLRDVLMKESDEGAAEMPLRIGIHLGPLKRVTNINQQVNAIGDIINAAQRVLSFVAPGQILVSRSFFDIVSCLSQEDAKLFHHYEIRGNKQIRDFDLYEVTMPGGPCLEGDHGGGSRSRVVGGQALKVREESTPILKGDGNTGWDAAWLAALGHHLAAYIGPIAQVLVKRAACKARDDEDLMQLLAGQLSEPARRQSFLASAPHVLNGRAKLPRSAAAPAKGSIGIKENRRADHSTLPGSHPRGLAPDVLRAAEQALALYLGPLAKVLVRRAAQTSRDRQDLFARLAEHLPAASERERFLRLVKDRDH